MKWVGYVACMVKKNCTEFSSESLMKTGHFED